MKAKARDDLTSILARLDQLETTNREQLGRISALEAIVASRLGVLPDAVAESTITPKEAAYEMDISVARVSQLIKSGRLKSVRVGGRQRVDLRSVDDYLRSAGRA
ncbi:MULTISPECIES: helix-turn-helix domain-containing protein [unclassified Bradyrhizobium]|uniref:helix-turn-helix domain-containing protein n=1 Tax=unclassified Bradyrhizobium TaxID=2631580 RepID=UPI002916FED8|nr:MULTISPECIES: helix-turn-helix domain-containing protein [unclassified Bradyrhizobium]